jgi:hypothetical protein
MVPPPATPGFLPGFSLYHHGDDFRCIRTMIPGFSLYRQDDSLLLHPTPPDPRVPSEGLLHPGRPMVVPQPHGERSGVRGEVRGYRRAYAWVGRWFPETSPTNTSGHGLS